MVERAAARALDGVGEGRDFVSWRPNGVLHYRRKLAPAELARLSPEWLAIPAVDMAGPPEE